MINLYDIYVRWLFQCGYKDNRQLPDDWYNSFRSDENLKFISGSELDLLDELGHVLGNVVAKIGQALSQNGVHWLADGSCYDEHNKLIFAKKSFVGHRGPVV